MANFELIYSSAFCVSKRLPTRKSILKYQNALAYKVDELEKNRAHAKKV